MGGVLKKKKIKLFYYTNLQQCQSICLTRLRFRVDFLLNLWLVCLPRVSLLKLNPFCLPSELVLIYCPPPQQLHFIFTLFAKCPRYHNKHKSCQRSWGWFPSVWSSRVCFVFMYLFLSLFILKNVVDLSSPFCMGPYFSSFASVWVSNQARTRLSFWFGNTVWYGMRCAPKVFKKRA